MGDFVLAMHGCVFPARDNQNVPSRTLKVKCIGFHPQADGVIRAEADVRDVSLAPYFSWSSGWSELNYRSFPWSDCEFYALVLASIVGRTEIMLFF